MTVINKWAMHFQSVWAERAANRLYPLWQRVAFLAYARHKANGHSTFQRGELSRLLGDGLKRVDTNNLQRAIRTAVNKGWLDRSSGAECLVVPRHAIRGGLGAAYAACAVHKRKDARRTEARVQRQNQESGH